MQARCVPGIVRCCLKELVRIVFALSMKFGRTLIQHILAEQDARILAARDRRRFRCKGKRKTCVKTLLGPIEFERNVYIDETVTDGVHCVYLLDEELGLERIGLVAEDVCEAAVKAACEGSYRLAAQTLTETTGLSISPQGVWNLVQKAGAMRSKQISRYASLAKQNAGAGCVETKLLYEEDDGIWLALQGRDRKQNGPRKEMKVGIAYDGVLWSGGKDGKQRRTLDNKVAYANFEGVDTYRAHKEGVVANHFDMDGVQLRIRSGDGAGWVQRAGDADIHVLDKFHRNRALLTYVQDPAFRKILQELLFKNDINTLLACIEAQINSTEDAHVKRQLQILLGYYTANRERLLGCYDRGITIPATREPGLVHHASLGSMESNVYTLIGNRMKGGRACWSVQGGNNLAALLCLHHTTGFAGLFGSGDALSVCEYAPEPRACSAANIPKKTGKGYDYPCRGSASSAPWLRNLTGFQSLSELALF